MNLASSDREAPNYLKTMEFVEVIELNGAFSRHVKAVKAVKDDRMVVTGTWLDYDFPYIGNFIIPGGYTTNQTKWEFQAWTGSQFGARFETLQQGLAQDDGWFFWMVDRVAYTIGGAYLARLVTRLYVIGPSESYWVLLLMVAKSCTSWWVIPWFIGFQHVSTILLVQDFANIPRSWWPLEWLILWRVI